MQSAPPLPPLADYYRRNELSVPAVLLSGGELPQPDEPLDGDAELTLLLGENGSVDAVITTKSSFPLGYFKLIEQFFSEMKFQPGTIDGVAKKSRFKIEVSTSRTPEILESKSLTDDKQDTP